MRYHFDLTDDSGATPDTEGVELGNLEQVRSEAWRALCGIAMDETAHPVDTLRLSLRVRDEADVVVYELSLSIAGKSRPH
jgi:hypothetical protein